MFSGLSGSLGLDGCCLRVVVPEEVLAVDWPWPNPPDTEGGMDILLQSMGNGSIGEGPVEGGPVEG